MTNILLITTCDRLIDRRSSPHMSALWMQTTAQANLCSSPPDRSSTFLSRRWLRSARQQHRQQTTNHSQTWRVQTGSERFRFQAACVFTELFTDDVLCVGVVLPAQDGSYWPLQVDSQSYTFRHHLTTSPPVHLQHLLPWPSLGSGRRTAAWRWPAGRPPGFWWSSSAARSLWSRSGSPASLEDSGKRRQHDCFCQAR